MAETEPSEAKPVPPPCADPAVSALEKRTGVRLSDPVVALAALTHKSYVNEHRGEALADNERLEFLGDAVIDLAVSHRLMERFPEAREGELSKIRAAVVDEAGLAAMARALDLGSLLRLGRGEELTGGRQKASLLADAMEAVIAAVYLGGGMGPVLELVDRFLGEAFARAAAGTLDRDFKTQLQELAQSRHRGTPRYRVVGEQGPDHSKTFEVELELRGEVLSRGAGRSKKDAEQAAAKLALEELAARAVSEGEASVRAAMALVPVEPREPDAPAAPAPASAPPPQQEAAPALAEASEPAAADLAPPAKPVRAKRRRLAAGRAGARPPPKKKPRKAAARTRNRKKK